MSPSAASGEQSGKADPTNLQFFETFQKGGGPPTLRLPREVLDAVSGAVAGAVARMVVSPLDVIKIRFQVQLEPIHLQRAQGLPLAPHASKYTGMLQATREIFREEGILGFWRGTVPGLLMVMPYCAIQFVVMHKCKSLLAGSQKEEDHHKLPPELSFAVGAVAGVAATVGSYPFDLLRTVLASQGEPKMYSGLLAACRGIVKQQGVQGLFSGISPTLAEIIPYAGLQIGLYDVFKRAVMVRNAKRQRLLHEETQGVLNSGTATPEPLQLEALDPLSKFLCGLAAGTLSKAACHPLDVVKKRFQVQGLIRHPRYGAAVQLQEYKGMVDALRKIALMEGVEGLYKGLLPSLIKAAPTAAVTFFVYEWVSKHLEALSVET